MIEFVLKNRKLRLHPDGVMYVRSINKFGEETKKETWKSVKFSNNNGYKRCCITLNRIPVKLLEHRIVWYANHQDWDIFNTSADNVIDHINRKKSDNRIENLKKTTQQENCFNTDSKGYSWHKGSGKWQGQITVNGNLKPLGYFDTEEDAHNAYLKAKEEYHITV